MGLMDAPPIARRAVTPPLAGTDAPGRLVVTPHPVTLEGQINVAAELRPGESLYAFLQRHVDRLDGQAWEVCVGGVPVPREHWHRVRPKDGQHIEVRAAVGRTALLLIATVALAYFTFGAGGLAGGSFLGLSGAAGAVAATAAYVAGSIIINKVLSPKPAKAAASDADSVYSLRGARNRARQFEPLGLLFGSVRIAPDIASNPYTWYEGDQQYLGMVLTPGVNVHRVEALYNGDALLSSFEGVQVWHNGFPGMADEDIPLYSNADTLAGGDLDAEDKGQVGPWVQRTSSPDTIRLQVDIEFQLFDTTSKGKPKDNSETFQIEYRPVGTSTWLYFGNYSVTSRSQRPRRVSYTKDVDPGQYDVRVRIAGNNTDGSGATARFTWSTLTSIQRDEASYAGIPRIGVRIQATGQLSGAPDELRCVAHSAPCPVWNGTAWVTEETSNPGAHILRYARGIHDGDGQVIAGMGLPDNQIDIPALQAFMLHCAANDYTYDYWVTQPRNHEEMLNVLALAGFGQVTWAAGKLSVAWAAEDQPLSGVVNMATIKRGQFQVDYTLANAADGIEYSFFDRTDWQPKPLRVAAPGVTTMLSPAQVQGEGITTEAHAAQLARWHLAQSLYQYKDISFGTLLEHLSYRRLSVLALQHDLTQWGYGGRVHAAVNAGGVVTLTLDEDVPSPTSGNAYMGLRIPGEQVYRVFQVAPFTGPSRTVSLVGAWPGDAALPGSSADNPAWDTIWVYDFKQTPGLRVRVVGIEPEDDLSGARVAVVPESPEFWTYVKTGEYTPPANQSLLQTRPVASNVRIAEGRVPQGNTVFIEITATFEVTGPVGVTVVKSAIGTEPLVEVAQTFTRTATWRVPEEGTYTFVIRPYSPEGVAGVPATIVHATAGAEVPPFDTFSVVEIGSGIRRYQWGYLSTTIQPPNLAGAEIRYTAGTVPDPDWETMIPVGEGFHTTTFEAVVPAAGTWTFAARARNTDGQLSGPLVITTTLGINLVEQINGIISDSNALENALAAEALERFEEDVRVAAEAAADATAKADAALATALDAIDEAVGAVVAWDDVTDYAAGQMVTDAGNLYLALQDVPAGTLLTDTLYWELIGEYESLGEALAASISTGEANADELEAQASRLDAVEARMPAGVEELATASSVVSLDARVTTNEGDIGTLATNLSAVEASLAGKADATAVTLLEGRVDDVEGDVTSLASAITAINAELDDKAEASAVTALASTVSTQGGQITANTSAISSLNATVGNHSASILTLGQVNAGANFTDVRNGSFEAVNEGWGANTSGAGGLPTGVSYTNTAGHTRTGAYALRSDGDASARNVFNAGRTTCKVGEQFRIGAYARRAPTAPSGGNVSVGIRCYDASGAYVSGSAVTISRNVASLSTSYELISTLFTIPETAVTFGVWVQFSHTAGGVIVDDFFADRLGEDMVNLRASWTLALTVDGYVSGIRTENTGATSSFDVFADSFRVMAPGGGARTEFSNGNWRVYDSSGVRRVRIGVW